MKKREATGQVTQVPMTKGGSPNRIQRPKILQRTQQNRSSSTSVHGRTIEWLASQLDVPSDPPGEEPDTASKDTSSDPGAQQILTPERSEPSPLSSGSETKEPPPPQQYVPWSTGVPLHTRPAQSTARDGEISVGDGTAWKEESQRRVDMWRAAARKNRAFAEMMEQRRRMHVPVDQWHAVYEQKAVAKKVE